MPVRPSGNVRHGSARCEAARSACRLPIEPRLRSQLGGSFRRTPSITSVSVHEGFSVPVVGGVWASTTKYSDPTETLYPTAAGAHAARGGARAAHQAHPRHFLGCLPYYDDVPL